MVVVVVIAVGLVGLDGNVRMRLGRCVVSLRSGVVLGTQLYSGLHGDVGVLGETVAAVGGWRAVAAGVSGGVGIRRLRLQLNHPVCAGAKEKREP